MQAVGGHSTVHLEAGVQGTQPRDGQVMTVTQVCCWPVTSHHFRDQEQMAVIPFVMVA